MSDSLPATTISARSTPDSSSWEVEQGSRSKKDAPTFLACLTSSSNGVDPCKSNGVAPWERTAAKAAGNNGPLWTYCETAGVEPTIIVEIENRPTELIQGREDCIRIEGFYHWLSFLIALVNAVPTVGILPGKQSGYKIY